jgi:hypothetical protein
MIFLLAIAELLVCFNIRAFIFFTLLGFAFPIIAAFKHGDEKIGWKDDK